MQFKIRCFHSNFQHFMHTLFNYSIGKVIQPNVLMKKFTIDKYRAAAPFYKVQQLIKLSVVAFYAIVINHSTISGS